MTDEQLNNIIESLGLSVFQRVNNKNLWDETLNKTPYKPVTYSNSSLDYQLAYQRGHGGSWRDISFIIHWDNKPIALWPLSFSVKGEQSMFTSHGLPVLPPLFVADCPSISQKRITKSCLDLANAISVAAKLNTWMSGESFIDSLGMSDWHVESMKRDSTCDLHHELYLDLRQNLIEIKRNFRRCYKSLISTGSRIWVVGVLNSTEKEEVWQEFRELHLKVSGRVTRSDETWAMQLRDIEQQRAFLVWLRSDSGEMVGGGLFNFTSDEGTYAVGAYNRSFFDKPMGHAVQYKAIEELKERGVLWYKLGARFFSTEKPIPTDKEISISEFKQGFSSHFFPHYCLTHKVPE